jgi:glycosyltransferase involved in cell wall biosynthesis
MYPTISIITLTYNAYIPLWEKTLKALHSQKYPKKNIEHIVMDGGSTNQTVAVAKKYGCKTFVMPKLKNNSEGRKGVGINKSKNEIILFLEADNIMVGNDWIVRMVEPFMNDNSITGTFSMWNTYEKNMPALTRYTNLIGINDPTVWYLGKSEKLAQFEKVYRKGTMLSDTNRYSVVRFDRSTLPTLGDNGHMVRRTLIAKVNKKPEEFLHTDSFVKLLLIGYDTYGVVKNAIIHYSGSNILGLYKRRITFKAEFFDTKQKKRMYYVFDKNSKKDRKNLLLFVLYSLTIVQPLLVSIRGYLAKPDSAWFLHPIVCFVATTAYGISEVSMVYHGIVKKIETYE